MGTQAARGIAEFTSVHQGSDPGVRKQRDRCWGNCPAPNTQKAEVCDSHMNLLRVLSHSQRTKNQGRCLMWELN